MSTSKVAGMKIVKELESLKKTIAELSINGGYTTEEVIIEINKKIDSKINSIKNSIEHGCKKCNSMKMIPLGWKMCPYCGTELNFGGLFTRLRHIDKS